MNTWKCDNGCLTPWAVRWHEKEKNITLCAICLKKSNLDRWWNLLVNRSRWTIGKDGLGKYI